MRCNTHFVTSVTRVNLTHFVGVPTHTISKFLDAYISGLLPFQYLCMIFANAYLPEHAAKDVAAMVQPLICQTLNASRRDHASHQVGPLPRLLLPGENHEDRT